MRIKQLFVLDFFFDLTHRKRYINRIRDFRFIIRNANFSILKLQQYAFAIVCSTLSSYNLEYCFYISIYNLLNLFSVLRIMM